MIKKENYAAPATEVLELRLEGTVLTGSEEITSGLSVSSTSAFGEDDHADW